LTADIHSNIIPNASDSYNLGSSGKKWEDIYVDDVIADTGAFTGAVGIDGNFDINTNKFTVNATTGDVVVAGTLDVTGVSTLSNDLAVDTNTLFVDVSTDSVGINTNTPAAAVSLEVSGDVLLQNTDEVKIKNFAGTSQTVLSVNASDSTIIQGSGGTESVAIKSSDGTSRITMTEAGVTAFTANTVVDTDTLFVDSVNDRVGINTSSPGFDLDVAGDVNLSGVIKTGGSSTANYYLKVDSTGNGMEYVDIQTVLAANSVIRGPATAPFPNVIGDERDVTMWQSNTVITGNTNMLTYDLSTGQLNVKSNGQTSAALSIQDSTNHAEFEKDDSLLSIRSGSGSGSILFSGATDSTNIGNFQVRSGGANQDIYHTGNLEVTELSRLVNTTTTSTAGNYYEIIRWDPTNLADTAVVLTLLITSNRSDSNDYNGSCSALVQVSLVQNDAASGNKIDPDIQLLSYSSYGNGSTENIIEDIIVATDIPAAFEAIQSVYIKSNIAGEIFTVQLLSESKTGSSVPDVSYPSSSWTTVPSNIQAQTGKIVRQSADFLPKRNNVYDLGSTTDRWAGVNSVLGNFSGTVTGPSGTWDSGGIDIASGDTYAIDGTNVLTATTLGSGVTSSSLTSVGTLNSGSITSGFGSINIGSSTFTGNGSGLTNLVAANISTGSLADGVNLHYTEDNATATAYFVSFTNASTTAASGNKDSLFSDKFSFTPSTGTLSANQISVDSSGLILDGSAVTATAAELNVLDGYTGSVTELNYLDTLHATGVTSTEFDYLDGVTSNIQTQLNGKQATITGGATTITSSNLTASRALISNASGKVAISATTSTELGYLNAIGTPTDGGIVYGDGIGLKVTAAGTTGQYLRSAGTGIPIWDTINLGTDTDGNYMVDASGGSGITVTHTPSEGSTATIAVDLTDTNIFASDGTVSRAVVLDGSGDFSAGTITASLSGTATTATNVTTTDNTATNETVYVAFVDGTSGGQGIEVDSTGLTYNPSTNTLTTGDVNISNGIQVNGVSGVNGQILAANTTGGIEWRDDVEVYNHTWALSGDVVAETLPCMFVLTGNTAGYDEVVKFSRYRAKITGGTSVDVKFQKNGVDIPNSSATITTAKQTVSSFTANTMINEDELTVVTSSPSGSPVNLSVTAFLTRQRFV
jgi:hypothetical protein